MNYCEVSAELVRLGLEAGFPTYAVKNDIADATAMHLPPIAWFLAFAPAEALFVGTYVGKERRIVGTKKIKFSELSRESLADQIQQARVKWVTWKLGLD